MYLLFLDQGFMLGESDQKESGHWDDQAEKLFSKSRMKSTYFLEKSELTKHNKTKKSLKNTLSANQK
jgi:hypothetical protein